MLIVMVLESFLIGLAASCAAALLGGGLKAFGETQFGAAIGAALGTQGKAEKQLRNLVRRTFREFFRKYPDRRMKAFVQFFGSDPVRSQIQGALLDGNPIDGDRLRKDLEEATGLDHLLDRILGKRSDTVEAIVVDFVHLYYHIERRHLSAEYVALLRAIREDEERREGMAQALLSAIQSLKEGVRNPSPGVSRVLDNLGVLAERIDYVHHEVDVRTLLLNGLAEQLRQELDSSKPSESRSTRALETLQREIRKLSYWLEAVLGDGRREAFSPTEMDARRPVRSALDIQSYEAESRRIDIRKDIGNSAQYLLGDADDLEKALVLLLGWILKYAAEDTELVAKLDEQGGHLALDFTYIGSPIAPDETGRAFTDGYRPSLSSAYVVGDSGRELAAARDLLAKHGGSISAWSDGTDMPSRCGFHVVLGRLLHGGEGYGEG